MVEVIAREHKLERFAPTPWIKESEEWLTLDQRVGPDHLARRVEEAVASLELQPLFASYLGVGKKALRPDLLLKLVIYELHNNRPSPAQWARDVRESEPVRWLLLGMEPSRARLYDFRDRIASFLPEWNDQVLKTAIEEKLTPATRVALDSSSVAAHASRRHFLNEERLEKRRVLVDSALERLAQGETAAEQAALIEPSPTEPSPTEPSPTEPSPTEPSPGWLAKSADGLREQKQRYQHAAAVLRERQAANAQRRAGKRRPADKVLVSPTDPDAVLARDKFNVFRPLYTVQLMRDLDSPMLLAYDVLAQNNDNGVVEPMVEQMADHVGHKPADLLVDSGYVSVHHLAFCQQAGITVYGPIQENDYSVQNGKKTQCNQKTELPKSAFRWLSAAQCYECPEGHRLLLRGHTTQQRAEHAITLNLYTCPPHHCLACPRQKQCTRSPQKGRTVSRMDNEEVLDALRARMQTVDAKRHYKLRSQTVERAYADLKEHRGLRRFHGRSLSRAKAEIGTLVLANNVLFVQEQRHERRHGTTEPTIPHAACAA